MENNDVNATVLLQMENVMMHRFVEQNKTLFTSGLCKIAKIENANSTIVYFLNLNSFYYTINKSIVFIRLLYQDTVSYLFPHFDNGMSAITIPSNSPHVNNLQEILENAATLTNYDTAMMDPGIRARIQQHCPNVAKEQIYHPDQVKKAIAQSGKFLGKMFGIAGNYLAKGIHNVGTFVNSKVQQGSQEIPAQTKKKWQEIKQGTSKVFTVSTQYASAILNPIVSPVIEKGKQWTKQVGEKIQKSQNQSVIYAREIGATSKNAIYEAISGLAQGTTAAFKEASEQTTLLWNKKYGAKKDKKQTEAEEQSGTQLNKSEQKLDQENEKMNKEFSELKTQVKKEDQNQYPKLE